MNKDFSNRRLDRFGVIPYSFLEEFRGKDASTRRYLLNSMTLFASISPEQQHQILNDLIQSELMNLAEQSKKYLHQNVKLVLKRMSVEKPLSEKEIAEYYYKYYTITGVIPEEVTNEYLNILVNFILGVEMSKLLFLMSFVEQQRFFELQENYSTQVVLFYRYIKPIRSKLITEKIVNRDIVGNYYYNRPWVNERELVDYIFDLFDIDKILYLGNCAKCFTFEKEYIYKAPDFE